VGSAIVPRKRSSIQLVDGNSLCIPARESRALVLTTAGARADPGSFTQYATGGTLDRLTRAPVASARSPSRSVSRGSRVALIAGRLQAHGAMGSRPSHAADVRRVFGAENAGIDAVCDQFGVLAIKLWGDH